MALALRDFVLTFRQMAAMQKRLQSMGGGGAGGGGMPDLNSMMKMSEFFAT